MQFRARSDGANAVDAFRKDARPARTAARSRTLARGPRSFAAASVIPAGPRATLNTPPERSARGVVLNTACFESRRLWHEVEVLGRRARPGRGRHGAA